MIQSAVCSLRAMVFPLYFSSYSFILLSLKNDQPIKTYPPKKKKPKKKNLEKNKQTSKNPQKKKTQTKSTPNIQTHTINHKTSP